MARVQLCLGVGLHPKSRMGAVNAHVEATQVLWWRWGAVLFRPLPPLAGAHPLLCTLCLYVLVPRACRNFMDFFSQICFTYLVIFTPLDHFLRELSFFKWMEPFILRNLKWLRSFNELVVQGRTKQAKKGNRAKQEGKQSKQRRK